MHSCAYVFCCVLQRLRSCCGKTLYYYYYYYFEKGKLYERVKFPVQKKYFVYYEDLSTSPNILCH